LIFGGGWQVDLVECIDWQSVECLNEKSTHTFVNALKQAIFLVDSHLISVTASLSLLQETVGPLLRYVPTLLM
jgi:hypothetical protein